MENLYSKLQELVERREDICYSMIEADGIEYAVLESELEELETEIENLETELDEFNEGEVYYE